MAFCIKRNESVRAAIRRLGVGRMAEALRWRDGWPETEAVHETRKDIKRTRALLRFVRDAIPRGERRRMDRLLREAAVSLAGPRDAFQAAATLSALVRRYRRRIAPGRFYPLEAALRAEAEAEAGSFASEGSAAGVVRRLRRIGKEFARLDMSARGWDAFGPGLMSAYREARRAGRSLGGPGSDEAMHRWRKRAKDLWFQMGLLRPIDPTAIDLQAAEFKALDRLLGDDHDLVALGQAAARLGSGVVDAAALAALGALITERRERLRAEALAYGARCFAEPTASFCGRLERGWRLWRKGKSARS